MKILKLRFKNIHSLKGEQIIDFTISPLRDAGLFAITGPTGAGKSTILDVITLALFNRVPRFTVKGTESISRNDIEKVGSILTHFTDEAYAEIEYECHNIGYRSKWSISRARTGNLRDYEMELATLADEKIMDLKKSEVPSENERLLGLKYEQFIRSILLSQGDFARFLKSDDKDRAKLLEDITGSQIYREIGKKVFETSKAKEDELKEWRLKSSMIQVLDDDVIKEKQLSIEANRVVLASLGTEISSLDQVIQKVDRKQKLLARLAQYEDVASKLKRQKLDFGLQEQKLVKHQQLDPFRSQLTLWQRDKERLTKLDLQNKENRTKEKAEIEKVNVSLQLLSDITKSKVTEDVFVSTMKELEQRYFELETQLSNIGNAGKTIRERLNQILSKDETYVAPFRALKSVDEQYQAASLRYTELEGYTQRFQGTNLELRDSLNSLQDAIVGLTAQYKDLKSKEELIEENITLQAQNDKTEIEIQRLNVESATIEQKIKDVKSQLDDAQKKKEHWITTATLEDHRNQLVDDEPCPLCGALEHPYAKSLPFKIGENEILITQLTNVYELATANGQKVKKDIAISSASIENNQKRISENLLKIGQIKANYSNLQMSSEEVSLLIIKQKGQKEELEKELKWREEKDFMTGYFSSLKEFTELLMQHKSVKQRREELYSGTDFKGEMDRIQGIYKEAKESLQRLIVTIQNTENDHNTLESELLNISKGLMKGIEGMGYQNLESAIAAILPDDELSIIVKRKEEMTQLETTNLANVKQTKDELLDFSDINPDEKLLNELRSSLADLNAKKDNLHQTNGAIETELKQQESLKITAQNIKNEIKKKEKEFAPIFLLNNLIGDGTGNKYAKFAQNISLKHLISLANHRLQKLTDRYILADTNIEEDLKVMDMYQGNAQRSVKTLSGGETFIVSLAMALSLADMASQNVRLDSLFIDEGFGTLDQETMEVALVTLEKLQSDGNRMIGIISHVESLKERISTQIKLKKDNFGYSTISVE